MWLEENHGFQPPNREPPKHFRTPGHYDNGGKMPCNPEAQTRSKVGTAHRLTIPMAWTGYELWPSHLKLRPSRCQLTIRQSPCMWQITTLALEITTLALSSYDPPIPLSVTHLCRAQFLCQGRLAQSVEHTHLEGSTRLGSWAFLSCWPLPAQRKVFLFLRESALLLCKRIPLKIYSLCLACFYCATTMQGLELDLRFCDGKLDCFFCWLASPDLPLDPFSSRERPRSSKKGADATSAQTCTFFQVLDPFSSRERPRSTKKGRRNLTSMCLPFRLQLAFSLAQGKCIASLQEDPAEDI